MSSYVTNKQASKFVNIYLGKKNINHTNRNR